jgi:hypothetical protein
MTLFLTLFIFLTVDALLSLREKGALKAEAAQSGLAATRAPTSPTLRVCTQTLVSLAVWLLAWPLHSLLSEGIFRPLFVFAMAPALTIGLSAYFYFARVKEVRLGSLTISRDLAYQALGCALILAYCLKLQGLGMRAEFLLFLSFSLIYAVLVYVLRAIFKKHRPGEACASFSGAPLLLIDIGLVALAASFLAKVDFIAWLGRF